MKRKRDIDAFGELARGKEGDGRGMEKGKKESRRLSGGQEKRRG